MSYGNPNRRHFAFGLIDFGTGSDIATSFKGPKGKRGTLVDIIVTGVEVFTTGGQVQVGTSADPNAYAEFAIGTLAATDTACATDGTTDPDAIIQPEMPAGQIEVVFVKTGGTPTGQGYVTIVVDYAD